MLSLRLLKDYLKDNGKYEMYFRKIRKISQSVNLFEIIGLF